MTATEMTISQFEAEVANALPGLRVAKAVLLEELRLRPSQRVRASRSLRSARCPRGRRS
jgi:hypothetical protein